MVKRGLEPVHGPLQGPQLGLRGVCLLPEAWVGESSPGSLGVWCWIPSLPQTHFCPWMGAKLFLRWGYELGTS